MDSILVIGLITASALDWKCRRIPNWLTFTLILIGLITNTLLFGTEGLINSFLGLLTGVGLLFIPFALRGLGGGDVKLMGALGACLGPAIVFKVFLATALIGGIFSLIEATRHGKLRKTLLNVKQKFIFMVLRQKLVPENTVEFSKNPIRIPYALAISLGYFMIHTLGGV